jgi:hypothetical protein
MNTTDTELEEHLKKDRMKPAWKRAYEFYKPLGHEEAVGYADLSVLHQQASKLSKKKAKEAGTPSDYFEHDDFV